MKIKINKYYISFVIILNIVCTFNFDYSGYTNIYAINKSADNSVIKMPFRLVSYDFTISEPSFLAPYNNFSISAKYGLEHKIKTLNSKAPLTNILYDLVSSSNVDYKSNFREYYISYFPSFGEIKIGKQLHAWGSVDGNSPVDVLNPIDYYYLFTDLDETKIGRESIVLDYYHSDNLKFQYIYMPNHVSNNIPANDPDFPLTLPATVEHYQFLDKIRMYEYGGYMQASNNDTEFTLYYFKGYDRNFNLHGANVFMDDWDINSVIDTVFSYRETEMIAISNVSFIKDLTIRSDFAYFQTAAASDSIESRVYTGQHKLSNYIDFNTLTATNYFDISAQYTQYCIQLEYSLPSDIDFTTQLFGYQALNVKGNEIQISIPGFEIDLDGKELFYPGLGSSTATLSKRALLFNFNKTFMDDMIEAQFTRLLDLEDNGSLIQLKLSYDIIEDLNLSILIYKGSGNRKKYPDITFLDQDGDGINDDKLDNETGEEANDGDGIPDADMFDESLLYPFNAMDDFSHIRFQLQYFF